MNMKFLATSGVYSDPVLIAIADWPGSVRPVGIHHVRKLVRTSAGDFNQKAVTITAI
jgi:hypothetical protein